MGDFQSPAETMDFKSIVVHLFVENPENSFVKDYMVKGIPRFILIDKEGNIINKNATRPSDSNITKEIESYL